MAGKLDPKFLKPIPDSKVNLSVGATAGKTISQALSDKSLPIGGAYDSGSCPIGSIIPWSNSVLPVNGDWLFCDGTAIDKTIYADLFVLLSTTYNTGGETGTQFRLPDFRGRSPIGAGTGAGLTARALGARLGEENHLLSAAEMPVHNHSASDSGHGHSLDASVHSNVNQPNGANTQFVGGSGSTWSNVANNGGNRPPPSAATSFANVSIGNAGSGSSHNVIHPSLVVQWIIRWRVTTQGLFLPDGSIPMVGNLDLGNNRVVNVAAPISGTDAINKTYLDGYVVSGEIKMHGGFTPPAGYLLCNGAGISRTSYAALFAALTSQVPATTTIGTSVVNITGDTGFYAVGMAVSGPGIPANTAISVINSATQITLNANCTATGSITLVVAPHGVGDGSTTFNVPDFRGRTPVGAGQGGGLTNRVLGKTVGEETHLLSNSEMPIHSHGGATGAAGSHSHQVLGAVWNNAPYGYVNTGAANRWSDLINQSGNPAVTDTISNHTHSISSDGGGAAHNVMQPSLFMNFIIKI